MKRASKKLLIVVAMFFAVLFAAAMLFASVFGKRGETVADADGAGANAGMSDSLEDTPASSVSSVEDSGIDLSGSTQITGTSTTVTPENTEAEISAILLGASAGDTITFSAGTYKFNNRLQLTNSGAYNGYIKVIADGDVIFDFSAMEFDGQNRGVQIEGNYWYWYGFEIMGAGDNGMFIGGNYNIIEYCEFHHNRDTGLQLGRSYTEYASITQWPSYNLVKNCTSYNNYDNETGGENADGFAAKLTVGYGNVFDGCIAYRNSDDGWDLYAYNSNGDIGAVILYNCVAFENGFLWETRADYNANFPAIDTTVAETSIDSYTTSLGDGNGFKLGGSVMRGNVKMYNCLSFSNKMHGVTDNSNPGVLTIEGVTSYNNGAGIDNDPASPTFGYVMGGAPSTDICNNIDVARADTSYNNLKDVLSVADSYGGPGNDAYKGSVTNSIFYAGTGYTQFTDYEDAYSEEGDGTALAGGLNSADVFEVLPYTGTAGAYTFNITGKNNADIHETYRNTDESLNMGNILAIKADAQATVNGAGATVNLSSWKDYTHYYDTSISDAASAEDAVLLAVYNTLYLYCDPNAVYQDMTLTTSMMGATITWSSDNEDILYISKQYNSSNSGSQDVDLVVYRAEQDTQVTLTANINYRGKTAVKTFTITVKADEPALGDVYVAGLENAVVESDFRFIIDQYLAYNEPELVVENAADINGKTLSESQYTVEAVYEYAESATSTYSRVYKFSPSVAGVYRITYNVWFNADPENVTTYTYYIYVASNTADIDFIAGTSSLNVYRDGYILSGDMTNVKGTLYAYSTSDATEIETLNALGAESQEELVAVLSAKEGLESYTFMDNSINAQFTNANNEDYTVYYWFANGAGEVTSQVYSQAVSVQEIASTTDFINMINSNNSYTIYLLTQDLDFSGVSYPQNISERAAGFKGLFNGNGHTISNISITGSGANGVFQYLYGGTIMNVMFEEIDITTTGQRAGIVAYSYGGYVHNVALKNINVSSTTTRAGGLIGHHTDGNLEVTQVALINDANHKISSPGQNDIGGIIGLVQSGSGSPTPSFGSVYIADVYVSGEIEGNRYIGGIIGRFEDRNVQDRLTIERCYVTATITANQYAAGIVGAQNNSVNTSNGQLVLTIRQCVFAGTMFYDGAVMTLPDKNGSGIMGRYTETAVVNIEGNISTIPEYFYSESYQVSTIAEGVNAYPEFWNTYVAYDFENVWEYVESEPYAQLRFDGMFEGAYVFESSSDSGEGTVTEGGSQA